MFKAYAVSEPGGKLEPYEYDPGPMGPQDVEIVVEHCGICYSDISMLQNEWGMTQYPFVPGHEIIGTIAGIGDQVQHIRPGQRVGLGWHAGYCMHCHSCMSGDHNLCAHAQGTLIGRHGGFADRVRAQAASVVELPRDLDAQSAGPLFCGGITVFNPLMQFNIKPTARVGVIGIGGLGHLALQFLNAWGCHVTAFTHNESKKDEILKLGAYQVLNSTDSATLEAAAGQFDLILSTVQAGLDWNAYVAMLSPKGRLHFVGATLEPLDIGVFPLILGQRSISGSPVGSPDTIRTMLDFAVQHKIKPVVEYFRFDQANEAIAHLASGKARYRVVLSNSG
ncbi:MAG: NAD(P)-dependent alcohol dehydrogenase [Burkholderiales bacterium]|nr:NAD(P)-dependent alcohol dehydrogenase [Nitrosomonas sp.]MCP5276359.1 NAD(P)-dependent alcohol dehydrogenase [Burkholderiales bacterium]